MSEFKPVPVFEPIPKMPRTRSPETGLSKFEHARALVDALDRAGGKCVYCGGRADSVDHADPLMPRDVVSNWVACCRSCNSQKGCRTPEQWASAVKEKREARMQKEAKWRLASMVDAAGVPMRGEEPAAYVRRVMLDIAQKLMACGQL